MFSSPLSALFDMFDVDNQKILTHDAMFRIYKLFFANAISDDHIVALVFSALRHPNLAKDGEVSRAEFMEVKICMAKGSYSSANDNILNSSNLTLSQTTNYRLYQTERVCRRQFQISCKWQNVPQTGRKHCGKRRNCLLRAISPFPTVFSKDFSCRHVKTRAYLGKG